MKAYFHSHFASYRSEKQKSCFIDLSIFSKRKVMERKNMNRKMRIKGEGLIFVES